MDVSFCDHVTLECSHCHGAFRAPAWLIVDAAARPDLVLEDKLFSPTCPDCGQPAEIDYPLLLYLPNMIPSLLFSPPAGYDQAMVQEQINNLIEQLREPLGDRWRQEWLGEDLPVIRHKLLASVVAKPQGVRQVLEIEALLCQARRALDAYQDDSQVAHLDEAVRLWDRLWKPKSLNAVTASFRLCLLNDGAEAYIQRYWARGNKRDLQLALSTWERVVAETAEGEPERPARLNNLGIALSDLHALTGKDDDLDRAIAAYDRAIESTTYADPDLAMYLGNLGTGLSTRYESKGQEHDLKRAAEVLECAVQRTPLDSPARPGRQNNLGSGLCQLYIRTGDRSMLERAILNCQEAAEALSPASPLRPRYLSNWASTLCLRHERTGNRDSLDQAIVLMREAVARTDDKVAERPRFICNLAGALLDRYECAESIADLDESIALAEGMFRYPCAKSDGAAIKHNLGKGLWNRYHQLGELKDLKDAVRLLNEAVNLTGGQSPSSSMYLDSLGNALSDLHHATGAIDSLSEALMAYRRATQSPAGITIDRLDHLGNKGSALTTLYDRTGDTQTLAEALSVCREAVEESEPGSVGRPRHLSNLASALNMRYTHTGQLHDIEEAVALLEEAVQETPGRSLKRCAYLNNLGNGLSRIYEHDNKPEILDRAITAYEEAAENAPLGAPDRPGYWGNLGNALTLRYALRKVDDDLEAAIDAHVRAVHGIPRNAPHRPGFLSNLGTTFLARYERSRDETDLRKALTALYEAVKKGEQSLALPGYLYNLGIGLSYRYRRTHRSSDYRNAVNILRQACRAGAELSPGAALNSASYWVELAQQEHAWGEVVEAGEYGMQAVEHLYRSQLSWRHKRLWLKGARGIAADTAYALARTGRSREAVLMLERDRARLLSEALERDRAEIEELAVVAPAISARYREVVSHLHWLESKEMTHEERLADGTLVREALAAAHNSLQEVIREIQQRPGYERFLCAPVWGDVSAGLGKAPLVYMVATPVGGLALLVWPDDEVSALWLDALTQGALREQVSGREEAQDGYIATYRSWREALSSSSARMAWPGKLADTIGWLRQALMDPVCQALEQRRTAQAVLIPTGLLTLLPLHAIESPIVLIYAPNARFLARARPAPKSVTPRILVVSNPNPSGQLNLRFSGIEAAAIREMLPNIEQRYLVGTEATGSNVLEQLPLCDAWHLITHGKANWRDALDSCLLMANEDAIALRQLMSLRTRASLAVLSACETTAYDVDVPDEVISLATTGMLQAGAACVVSSSWAVEDLSTAILMRRFYEELAGRRDGHPKSVAIALHLAQAWFRGLMLHEARSLLLELMSDPSVSASVQMAILGQFVALESRGDRPFAHPYYWAGFCATGNAFATLANE